MDEGEERVLIAASSTPSISRELSDLKRQSLQVLFPLPDELPGRIPLIMRLRGREPDIYTLYGAAVEYECWKAIEEGRLPRDIDPIEFFKENSVSLGGGKGRKEAVEISRTPQPDGHRKSLMGRLLGR